MDCVNNGAAYGTRDFKMRSLHRTETSAFTRKKVFVPDLQNGPYRVTEENSTIENETMFCFHSSMSTRLVLSIL
jgi:hypothetical protein